MTIDRPGESGQDLPLTLYIHIPWCVRKCPYCDFNSHAVRSDPPFDRYLDRLRLDLESDLRSAGARRPLDSIFIGGGTPSLLTGDQVRTLLDGVRQQTRLAEGVEITLEANPGAADAAQFEGYLNAGVNRLSIGVQSLSADQLRSLGRIHGPDEARAAVAAARDAGCDNLNLDMMFALPGQSLDEAGADLKALIELDPEHVSYYQLTLEPNTAFHAAPPQLPDGDLAADLSAQGLEILASAGFLQYEVSAYAKAGRRCRHNLNYWRFGDYLGIGAGAHGKLTEPLDHAAGWRVRRSAKHPHPATYLTVAPDSMEKSHRTLTQADLVFEFALNGMRLTDGFEQALFRRTTGLRWGRFALRLTEAIADGLVTLDAGWVRPTALGRRFLDDLVERFVPGSEEDGLA